MGYDVVLRSRNRFLPFEEARDYVRKLNLQSSVEWKEYSKTDRPDFIPANPFVVYKGDYIDFQDWCGYDEIKYSIRENFLKNFKGKPPRQVDENSSAMEMFEKMAVTGSDGKIQAFRLPRDVKGGLLLRFDDSKRFSENLWFRVHVRSASLNPKAMRNCHVFGHVRTCHLGEGGLVLIKSEDKEMFMMRTSDISTKNAIISPGTYEKYSKFRIDSNESLMETVQQWYQTLPKQSFEDWMQDYVDPSWYPSKFLFQAEELYQRCGLSISFPSSRQTPPNVKLGSYHGFHRVLVKKHASAGWEIQLSEKRGSDAKKTRYPLDFDSEIDFILASHTEDDLLQGVYVFPKNSVKELFTTPQNVGRQGLSVFPPNLVRGRSDRFSLKKQQKQLEYYMDLSDPEDLPVAEAKLRKILTEVDAFKQSEALKNTGQQDNSSFGAELG